MTEMKPPLPQESPKPDAPEVGADDARHDTGEIPVTMGTMRKAFRINEVWTFLVAVATAGAALLGGYTLFVDKAEAAGRKVAEEAQAEAKAASKKADVALAQGDELGKDMRALYRATMYRERQERLEHPLPAPAPPQSDGGK